MILVIAPYTNTSDIQSTNLGASRKIEIIINILYQIDKDIVLVNSALNSNKIKNHLSTNKIMISDIEIEEITPPVFSKFRKFSKLLNLFHIDLLINHIKKNYIDPKLIWFYNGYSFEMAFAIKAKNKFNTPMILEFEDWHFSRSNFLNIKASLDYIYWRAAVRNMRSSFVVNSILENKMRPFVNNVDLLPGVVPNIIKNTKMKIPFSNLEYDHKIHIGYFGGLYEEKGADLILNLVNELPSNYIFHITGSGNLNQAFIDLEKKLDGQLIFYGKVNENKLYQLIGQCDVILNPHKLIENFNNGIFPFKVVEAISSGRLVISTPLPSKDLEGILNGIILVSDSLDSFKKTILESPKIYKDNFILINNASKLAIDLYGENSILFKINEIIEANSI